MEEEKYSCLVVDDEPIARKIIVHYLQQLPFLGLAAECNNALSAIAYLKAHRDTHIIFLDINMPNLSGLQFIKILQPHQPVIFTTAYAEHALESYELNAVDYLLKPFSFDRFAKAVYKAADKIKGSVKHVPEVLNKPVFFIKSGGKNHPVELDDILYCEARKNYTMVVLKDDQRLMPLVSLSKFETMLLEAGGEFIQTHRSFLIAKKHITAIAPGAVMINKFEIPIGVHFKERFLRAVGIKNT